MSMRALSRSLVRVASLFVLLLGLALVGGAFQTADAARQSKPAFQDTFSHGDLSGWTWNGAAWSIAGKALTSPNGPGWYTSEIAWPVGQEGNAWTDYVFQGRFKLNTAKEADIVFRLEHAGSEGSIDSGSYFQVFNANDGCGSHLYAIHGYYGYGATAYGCAGNTIDPNVWHNFMLVVTGHTVDYYLDAVLVIHVSDVDYWCEAQVPGCYVGGEHLSYSGGVGVRTVSNLGGAQFDNLMVRLM